VHVDEHVRRPTTQRGQRRVNLGERRPCRLDEERAREVHDPKRHPVALYQRGASAWAALGVVRRSHDPLVAVEEVVDLRVPVGVVAERQCVGAGVQQLERCALGDPDPAGRVLAVGDYEVRVVAFA